MSRIGKYPVTIPNGVEVQLFSRGPLRCQWQHEQDSKCGSDSHPSVRLHKGPQVEDDSKQPDKKRMMTVNQERRRSGTD